jgi:predicted transposase YdaD
MAKAYDATTRQLIEMGPAAWLEYLGIPVSDPTRVKVIDSNLSTVSAEADRVLWIDEPEPWIEHLELQAGRDVRLDDRGHFYSTLLEHHYGVPVRTTLFLLRPEADGPELTGLLEKRYRDGTVYDRFRYDVVRVWEQPVERFLQAGLPVLPLAPVSNVGLDRLPEVLTAIAQRLRREATPEQTATIWKATTILLSLRYRREQIEGVVREVSTMSLGIRGIEESWLYQDYFKQGVAEGRAEGMAEGMAEGVLARAREDLLRLGRKKLGPPTESAEAEIAALEDLERLSSLLDRILDVSTWDELLTPPQPPEEAAG